MHASPSPHVQGDPGADAEGEVELEHDAATPLSGKAVDRDRRESTQDTPSTSRLGTPAAADKKKKAASVLPSGKRARKPKSEESKEKDRLRKKAKRVGVWGEVTLIDYRKRSASRELLLRAAWRLRSSRSGWRRR